MDQSKAAAFIEENMKTIFAYSLSRVSHKEDAEDLCGDIFLAILGSAPRIRDDNAFFAYVWSIASNTYKKFLRKKKRAVFTEIDESIPSDKDFTDDICRSEELSVLRRELSLLSREYRECTVAYYFDGLSCAETAARLGISLEMVKYYLFKTRKLLKEGIGMEREFGEKSYKPGKFEFTTIYTGMYNAEYSNMFKRKLPGNILLSAYYTPMTVRELSVELGVAAVYLEDEIDLLEKYGLIIANGGKYQTRLVIYTEDYMREFYKSAEKLCIDEVKNILQGVKSKLDDIRELGFMGSKLDNNRLTWAMLFPLMLKGITLFKEAHSADAEEDELYSGATGTNYGIAFDRSESEYGTGGFAGYSGIDDDYAASFADFGVLPKKNWYTQRYNEVREHLYSVIEGKNEPCIPILSCRDQDMIMDILDTQIKDFSRLYEMLFECAVDIMKAHAPDSVSALIKKVSANTLLFHTVGLIGAMAVRSGCLALPETEKPTAALIYRTAEEQSLSAGDIV